MTDPLAWWGDSIVVHPKRADPGAGFVGAVSTNAGRQVGALRMVGRVGRPAPRVDLQLVDERNVALLSMSRHQMLRLGYDRERWDVYDGLGTPIGTLEQNTGRWTSRKCFSVIAGGQEIGRAQRATSLGDIALSDSVGRQLALVTSNQDSRHATAQMAGGLHPVLRGMCVTVAVAEYLRDYYTEGARFDPANWIFWD